MTSIHLKGVSGAGWAEYGRKSAAEMVEQIRDYARHQMAIAEAILAAPASDFTVATYVGVHVQRKRETIQDGLCATTAEGVEAGPPNGEAVSTPNPLSPRHPDREAGGTS